LASIITSLPSSVVVVLVVVREVLVVPPPQAARVRAAPATIAPTVALLRRLRIRRSP
jgi:hypothetical protein